MRTRDALGFPVNLLIPFSASAQTWIFNLLKFSVSSGFHFQAMEVFSLCLNFSIVTRVSWLRQKVLWLIRPRNPRISLRCVGILYWVIASNWFREGLTPPWVILNPKISVSSSAIVNFSWLNMMPIDPQNWRYFQTCKKACRCVVAQRSVSCIQRRHAVFFQCLFESEKHLKTLSGSLNLCNRPQGIHFCNRN